MSLSAWITAGSTAFAAGCAAPAGAVWACRPGAANNIASRPYVTMLRAMIISRVASAVELKPRLLELHLRHLGRNHQSGFGCSDDLLHRDAGSGLDQGRTPAGKRDHRQLGDDQ